MSRSAQSSGEGEWIRKSGFLLPDVKSLNDRRMLMNQCLALVRIIARPGQLYRPGHRQAIPIGQSSRKPTSSSPTAPL